MATRYPCQTLTVICCQLVDGVPIWPSPGRPTPGQSPVERPIRAPARRTVTGPSSLTAITTASGTS